MVNAKKIRHHKMKARFLKPNINHTFHVDIFPSRQHIFIPILECLFIITVWVMQRLMPTVHRKKTPETQKGEVIFLRSDSWDRGGSRTRNRGFLSHQWNGRSLSPLLLIKTWPWLCYEGTDNSCIDNPHPTLHSRTFSVKLVMIHIVWKLCSLKTFYLKKQQPSKL